MTVDQVAKYLQVSRQQVYVYIEQKTNPLPSFKLSEGTRRVKRQDLIDWMARHVLGGQE